MEITLKSGSRDETFEIGSLLGELLDAGDVLCLEGDLGTGKTVLVQGLARARRYDGPVPSPTFTIINPYPEIALCHVDAFRLSGPGELIDTGIEEYLDGDWICAVEWAEKVRQALPAKALEVRIEFGAAEDDRTLCVTLAGGWDGRAGRMKSELSRYA
jgi:tRNA threonylcarbamoyladenosine biosynthesis protein TsaE